MRLQPPRPAAGPAIRWSNDRPRPVDEGAEEGLALSLADVRVLGLLAGDHAAAIMLDLRGIAVALVRGEGHGTADDGGELRLDVGAGVAGGGLAGGVAHLADGLLRRVAGIGRLAGHG